jgi:hypothetical protein
MSAEVTYKTHILIGVRENVVMTVIADWPHVPTDVASKGSHLHSSPDPCGAESR